MVLQASKQFRGGGGKVRVVSCTVGVGLALVVVVCGAVGTVGAWCFGTDLGTACAQWRLMSNVDQHSLRFQACLRLKVHLPSVVELGAARPREDGWERNQVSRSRTIGEHARE